MNRRQFFKTLIGAAIAAKILPERTTAMNPAFGYPYGKYKTGLVGDVHDFVFRPSTYSMGIDTSIIGKSCTTIHLSEVADWPKENTI